MVHPGPHRPRVPLVGDGPAGEPARVPIHARHDVGGLFLAHKRVQLVHLQRLDLPLAGDGRGEDRRVDRQVPGDPPEVHAIHVHLEDLALRRQVVAVQPVGLSAGLEALEEGLGLAGRGLRLRAPF